MPGRSSTIIITRIAPGHQQVAVEWTPVDGAVYQCVEVKLRGAGWDSARCVRCPAGLGTVTVPGLMNDADHVLRVTALDTEGKVLAVSGERLATPGWVPGTVIDYLHRDDTAFGEWGRYIGSPSVCRLPSAALVASHDLFGPGPQCLTRVFRSEDEGASWRHLTDLHPAFWGKLFVHRGALHLLATRTEYGDLLLYRAEDEGSSWAGPAVIAPGTYHKAPVPVIEHRGRLWTCAELQTGGWPEGFQSVVCSAPVEADLMRAASWTVSAPLAYDPAWLPEGWEVARKDQGFLEGNAVVAPDGRLLNLLRYNTVPYANKAIVLEIAEDGRSQRFERVIDFPGGMTKFTVQRRLETGVYWSLVNPVTILDKPNMRSVLSLASSTDLRHWTVHRDVLRDDSPWAVQYTGFQYVDWLFDGPDLLAACRLAYRGARNFHDANHLTFHRVEGFDALSGRGRVGN